MSKCKNQSGSGIQSNPQVPDEVALEEEVYEDEDDENAESNWRNDYPEERDSDDECDEERFGGVRTNTC